MTDDLTQRAKRIGTAVRKFEQRTRPGSSTGVRVTILDDSRAGGAGLDRLFVGLGATMNALPQALTDALPSIRAAHRRNFTTEGASGRGRWAPLAPSTILERARLGYPPGPILKRTGALQRHVLSTPAVVRRTRGGAELRIAPANTVAGIPKYRTLALGGRTPTGGRVPGRPMVTIGPEGAKRITSAISRSLRATARRHGIG